MIASGRLTSALVTFPWVTTAVAQGEAAAPAETEQGEGDESLGRMEAERAAGDQPDAAVHGFDAYVGETMREGGGDAVVVRTVAATLTNAPSDSTRDNSGYRQLAATAEGRPCVRPPASMRTTAPPVTVTGSSGDAAAGISPWVTWERRHGPAAPRDTRSPPADEARGPGGQVTAERISPTVVATSSRAPPTPPTSTAGACATNSLSAGTVTTAARTVVPLAKILGHPGHQPLASSSACSGSSGGRGFGLPRPDLTSATMVQLQQDLAELVVHRDPLPPRPLPLRAATRQSRHQRSQLGLAPFQVGAPLRQLLRRPGPVAAQLAALAGAERRRCSSSAAMISSRIAGRVVPRSNSASSCACV
jgi:hypothetical protein